MRSFLGRLRRNGESGEKEGEEGSKSTGEKSAEEEKKLRTPLETLRLFAEAYSRIKQNYVESVDDKELIEHAIRGMLEGLDPHSDFLWEMIIWI